MTEGQILDVYAAVLLTKQTAPKDHPVHALCDALLTRLEELATREHMTNPARDETGH